MKSGRGTEKFTLFTSLLMKQSSGSQNSQNGPTKYIYLDSNWFPLAQTNRQEVGATMLSELARNFHFSKICFNMMNELNWSRVQLDSIQPNPSATFHLFSGTLLVPIQTGASQAKIKSTARWRRKIFENFRAEKFEELVNDALRAN